MGSKTEKHLGLRIDLQTHAKLKYIAAREGRSINGQVLYLIRSFIDAYEKENDPISVEDKSK